MKKIVLTMFLTIFISIGGMASAATMSYDLNFSNLTGDGGPWATVKLTDITNGVHFEVDMAPNMAMRDFYFNTDLSLSPTAVQNISSVATHSWNVNTTQQADGFGNFDLELQTTGQHNVSILTFDVISTGAVISNFYILAALPAGNGLGHFAAQLWDTSTGSTTTFFARDGGQVPEPSTLLLFGSGLLGLGFLRFRHRK